MTDRLVDADVSAQVAAWFSEHAVAVEAVARGLTRDADLAADVCQSVFAKALTAFDTVPSGFERAWLLHVAKNEAIDLLRRRGRERSRIRKRPVPPPASDGRPDHELERNEQADAVRKLMENLPEDDRDLLTRRYNDGQTFATIAEQTGRPLGTVLSRAHRLMKQLQNRLRGMNIE